MISQSRVWKTRLLVLGRAALAHSIDLAGRSFYGWEEAAPLGFPTT